MTTIAKYSWLLTILIVGVGVYLLFTGDCNESTATTDAKKKQVDSANRVLSDSLETYKRFDKEKVLVIASQDSTIQRYRKADQDAKAAEQTARTELNKVKASVLQLRKELLGYRSLDTGTVFFLLDSLLNETRNLAWLLDQYMAATDSLTTIKDSLTLAIDQQKSNYESLAVKRAQLLTQMRTQYDNVYAMYNRLYSDNKGLQKSLKREKVKTKVAVIIALAEAILLSIK